MYRKRKSIAQRAAEESNDVIIDLTRDESPIRYNDISIDPKKSPNVECFSCKTLIDLRFLIEIRNCPHKRCILCVVQIIKDSPTVLVKCPLCDGHLDDQEIRVLLTTHEYSIHAKKDSLYEELLDLEEKSGFVPSTTVFTCAICLVEVDVGDGITLRRCLHEFSIDCVRGNIKNSTEPATVKCPADQCEHTIEDREIRALLTQAEFDQHSLRMMQIVESQSSNSFHCKKPNCLGWAFVEDAVSFFKCPVCSSINCLSCQVRSKI